MACRRLAHERTPSPPHAPGTPEARETQIRDGRGGAGSTLKGTGFDAPSRRRRRSTTRRRRTRSPRRHGGTAAVAAWRAATAADLPLMAEQALGRPDLAIEDSTGEVRRGSGRRSSNGPEFVEARGDGPRGRRGEGGEAPPPPSWHPHGLPARCSDGGGVERRRRGFRPSRPSGRRGGLSLLRHLSILVNKVNCSIAT